MEGGNVLSVLEFRVVLVFDGPVENVEEVQEKVRNALSNYRDNVGIAPEDEEVTCRYVFVEATSAS
jgi:hypothetical protein